MISHRISVALLVMLCILLGIGVLKRQEFQDWLKLRGYTPPSSVVTLANEDTMNTYTRHLFYLNRPKLPTTVAAFRTYCPENEDTIVLGCYHPNQNGIYIYAVQDVSLAGIQQVTAAHEVLHAVYARLNSSERTKLDAELEFYYLNGLTDSDVKNEVAIYQKTEPNDVFDEMSCTFGTEIKNLPASLNAYYAQYFNNRQAVVSYEQQYQTQFTSRQQQVSVYDSQLSTMKTQINQQQSSLTTENSNLSNQDTQLQSTLASGDTQSYNNEVDIYNARVDSYDTELANLKNEITTYNQLVGTRNTLAGQLTTLDSAIDTRVPAAVSR